MSETNLGGRVFIQTVFDNGGRRSINKAKIHSKPSQEPKESPKTTNKLVLPNISLIQRGNMQSSKNSNVGDLSDRQEESLNEFHGNWELQTSCRKKRHHNHHKGQERLRVLAACDRCKKRKKKCDGLNPCSNCLESSNECSYVHLTSKGVLLQYEKNLNRNGRNNSKSNKATEENQSERLRKGNQVQNSNITLNPHQCLIPAKAHPERHDLNSKPQFTTIEKKMERLQKELTNLKEDLKVCKDISLTPNVTTDTRHKPSDSSPGSSQQLNEFYGSVWLLLKDTNGESVAGPTAIITKVNFIKNWIASKIFREAQSSLRPPPDHDVYIKSIDQDGLKISIPPTSDIPLEKTYVEYYYSLMSQRYYFFEKSHIEDLIAEYVETGGKFDANSKLNGFQDDAHKKTAMFLVLAVGCRLLKLSKGISVLTPKIYFDKAIDSLSKIGPELNLVDQIRLIMLIALYSLHSYNHNIQFIMNIWELSGLAIRKMTQVGLHRYTIPTLKTSKEYEMKKRLFWSIYSFEKILCLTLGRPASISDDEIDVPYPLNIDSLETLTNEELLHLQIEQQRIQYETQNHRVLHPAKVSLTYYLIQLCQVREIEARISRLERMMSIPINLKNVRTQVSISGKYITQFNKIQQDLEIWRKQLPSPQEFNEGMQNQIHFQYLVMCYHRAKVFLYLARIMQNQTKDEEMSSVFCETCEAAGGVCRSYMIISKGQVFAYSMFTLHTLFLVGILLTYCILNLESSEEQGSNSAKDFSHGSSILKFHEYLRQCSVLLTLFSERTKKAASFKILFDKLLEDGSFSIDNHKARMKYGNSKLSTETDKNIPSNMNQQTSTLFRDTITENGMFHSRFSTQKPVNASWIEKNTHDTGEENVHNEFLQHSRMSDHYGLREFMNIFSDTGQTTFPSEMQPDLNMSDESEFWERK